MSRSLAALAPLSLSIVREIERDDDRVGEEAEETKLAGGDGTGDGEEGESAAEETTTSAATANSNVLNVFSAEGNNSLDVLPCCRFSPLMECDERQAPSHGGEGGCGRALHSFTHTRKR